eukprot:TRINITY_DN28009_c0_g1_i1.p1 TRINITY_DN28009_c0_g1~~TRINITY_DN28009_c0_g1_i1.p1  ORF type:complete len:815 (-),score=122.46 TRINITY_DN28009_c0_g1_i1:29-2425(-)
MGNMQCCQSPPYVEECSAYPKTIRSQNSWDQSTSMPRLIMISDPGQDLDDEMMFIMLRYLVERDLVDVQAIICTLAPAFDRARLCRGTLSSLGLGQVKVGLGSDGGDLEGKHKAETFERWARPYMPPRHSSIFKSGQQLLNHLYAEAEPKSLTILVTASLKDIALFLRDFEELFHTKTRELVIMGGVEPWKTGDEFLVPDKAHNQMFDRSATEFVYRRCQELGVRLIVVSRWAAYVAKMPRSCYDDLARSRSWVGCRLKNAQRHSIEGLWNRACSTGEERMGLPERCDRAWFLKTFCADAAATGRTAGETIWDLVVDFMQYDTVALLAAIPEMRSRFFRPKCFPGKENVEHFVVGYTEEEHNVLDASDLTNFLTEGYRLGVAFNNEAKVQVIIVTQPNWDNMCEELLGCIVLRTLWGLGILDCVGIVISPQIQEAGRESVGSHRPANMTSQDALTNDSRAAAKEVRLCLQRLGLGHVIVLEADEYHPTGKEGVTCVSDCLKELYKKVSPAGATLVVTGSLGGLADFADTFPEEYTQKTQACIVLGSACVSVCEKTGDPILTPDPTAHNFSADLQSAERFFKKTQDLLVPKLLITRHCSGNVQIPRDMFDRLGEHGAEIGKDCKALQEASILKLWEAVGAKKGDASRRGLPNRCDTDWFNETFCDGKLSLDGTREIPPSDVWNAVKRVNIYSPLAILMAVPAFLKRSVRGTKFVIRSVNHTVVGLTSEETGMVDVAQVKGVILQCLFSGCRVNESRFDFKSVPPIALGPRPEDGEWSFDKHFREALKWMTEMTQNDDES